MFLGIDLGTSGLKLLLLSEKHGIEAVARAPLSLSRPLPRWSEQDPQAWWTALDITMTSLASTHPKAMAAVRGIGLSGQMHGAVLLDERDSVLRPAILWNDGRSAAQCEVLMRKVPAITRIAGNFAMPGFTAPKLLWVQEHEPSIFARIARVLLPKDYLRLRLTGEAITDCSDASGTLWLDVARRDWSDEVLFATGLTRRHMPELVEGSAPAGKLDAVLTGRWGMSPHVVVAGGGGDNAASAVAVGAVEPGRGFVSLGTSGVIFVADDRFRPHPESAVHTFCHALPDRWHRMSVMLSASSCLVWATRFLGLPDVPHLLSLAETVDPAGRATAPLFLPYLSGERTPYNDASAQGVLFGLSHEHTSASIAWSVLEGVCFGLLDGLDALAPDASSRPGSLSVVGGGARSAFWVQQLASVLDVELVVSEGHEAGAALGAAMLGGVASGALLSDLRSPASDGGSTTYKPLSETRALAIPRHAKFRALYSTLKSTFANH